MVDDPPKIAGRYTQLLHHGLAAVQEREEPGVRPEGEQRGDTEADGTEERALRQVRPTPPLTPDDARSPLQGEGLPGRDTLREARRHAKGAGAAVVKVLIRKIV